MGSCRMPRSLGSQNVHPLVTSPRYENSLPCRLPHWSVSHTSGPQSLLGQKVFLTGSSPGRTREKVAVLDSSKRLFAFCPLKAPASPSSHGAPGRQHLISDQASFELAPNAAHPLSLWLVIHLGLAPRPLTGLTSVVLETVSTVRWFL